jgi:hypothetical protein
LAKEKHVIPDNMMKISRPMVHLVLSAVMSLWLFAPAWSEVAPADANQPSPPANAAKSPAMPDLAPEALVAGEAVISEVQGASVQVSLDSGQKWQKATKGMKVGKNAALRTGFASSCELSFGGRSVVQIQALSSVKVADYQTSSTAEKVLTNLQYGAVRCGVEKGRIKTDTTIRTPAAIIAIRGTITYMSYDPGTQRCELGVDKDGPILATSAAGQYTLYAGMRTNETLSRFLHLAIFDRTVWVNGNYRLGEISEAEGQVIAFQTNDTAINPTEGAGQFSDPKSIDAQQVPLSVINNCPGGICD